MDRSTLHRLRLIVPGIMIFFLALTLKHPGADLLDAIAGVDFGGLSVAGLAGVVGGALYTVLDIRRRCGEPWGDIRANIENRLLAVLSVNQNLTESQKAHLRGNRRLLDVFYRLLDNDESLKSRQEGVRFNGLLVTSIVDLSAIAAAAWGLHFAMLFVRPTFAHMLWSTAGFVLWILSRAILLPLALRRHQELSNEQLDYIETNLRADFVSAAQQLLSRMPAPSG